jgi:hypothetical protein
MLEGVGDVHGFGGLRIDPVVLVPPAQARAAKCRCRDRVGGGEQGDEVTGGDEAVGEQGCEELPRAVVAGRGPPRDGREDADPQW